MGNLAPLSSRAIMGQFYDIVTAPSAENDWAAQAAHQVDSDQASEKYVLAHRPPAARIWKGPRLLGELGTEEFEIKNEHYESSIQIPMEWIRRDKTGQIDMEIQGLAARMMQNRENLMAQLLIKGDSQTCFDGQYFFDTDHRAKGSASNPQTDQSNKISLAVADLPSSSSGGTKTNPTPEQFARAAHKGVAQILAFVDDQRQPFDQSVRRFMVLCPTSMLPSASGIFAEFVNSGQLLPEQVQRILSNFSIEIVQSPYLDAAGWEDKFVVLCIDGATRSLIWQRETDIMMQSLAEGSEQEFTYHRWLFGASQWCGAGYFMWQRACLVTLT